MDYFSEGVVHSGGHVAAFKKFHRSLFDLCPVPYFSGLAISPDDRHPVSGPLFQAIPEVIGEEALDLDVWSKRRRVFVVGPDGRIGAEE